MSTGRSYAGESPQARSTRRHAQLLEAGLEVFGTIGYRRATVRLLCRQAQVADRCFYEHFDSTEALLLAVYHHCMDRLEHAVETAVGGVDGPSWARTHAGVRAALETAEADVRLCRVVWFEVLGVSLEIEAAHMARGRRMADRALQSAGTWVVDDESRPTPSTWVRSAFVAGGISHVVRQWVHDGFQPALEDVLLTLTRVFVATSELASEPGSGPASPG